MRVAALIATEAISGPGRQLAALAKMLPEAGVQMDVLLTARSAAPPPYAEYLRRAGVRYAVIPDRGPLDWRVVQQVRSYLDAHGIELLQTHGYKATAAGYALRRLGSDRPWVGFYHGATNKDFKDLAWQRVEHRLIRAADRVIVVSAHQAALFSDHARVRVVSNAVVPQYASAHETDVASLRAAVRPRIGVVGRLSHEKGVDVFLRACALLRRREIRFSAFIFGEGPARSELMELSRRLGLEQLANFAGHVDAPGAVYPHLDLVVLPSRSEGLPNVLLEALAADRPVVATAVGAVPEVLAEAGAGLLCPPDDPAALADCIVEALQHGSTPGAARARQSAVARYTPDARLRQHLELYAELVESPLLRSA
jgi:glycosyltransferase involved in cell wall biosynthesis